MMQLLNNLKFNDKGLIPAIIVDMIDNRVLTLCYMNQTALEKTIETGKVYVFRRSKNRLMLKGETSGHIQLVKEVFLDCEGNSLVIKVEQNVAACHEGYRSCYFRKYNEKTDNVEIVEKRIFDPEKIYKA
ncbi:MAG: phosphoribosyl-AMP cyclohydrolase [Candidatus Scalinduaceae bacterium]